MGRAGDLSKHRNLKSRTCAQHAHRGGAASASRPCRRNSMRMSVRSMVAFTVLGLAGVAAGGIAAADEPTPDVEEQAATPAPALAPHGFVQIIGEARSEV